eukprot:IDg5625t1
MLDYSGLGKGTLIILLPRVICTAAFSGSSAFSLRDLYLLDLTLAELFLSCCVASVFLALFCDHLGLKFDLVPYYPPAPESLPALPTLPSFRLSPTPPASLPLPQDGLFICPVLLQPIFLSLSQLAQLGAYIAPTSYLSSTTYPSTARPRRCTPRYSHHARLVGKQERHGEPNKPMFESKEGGARIARRSKQQLNNWCPHFKPHFGQVQIDISLGCSLSNHLLQELLI